MCCYVSTTAVAGQMSDDTGETGRTFVFFEMDMSTTPRTTTTSVISTITVITSSSVVSIHCIIRTILQDWSRCIILVRWVRCRTCSRRQSCPISSLFPAELDLPVLVESDSKLSIYPASLPSTTMVEIRMLPEITRLTQVSRPCPELGGRPCPELGS